MPLQPGEYNYMGKGDGLSCPAWHWTWLDPEAALSTVGDLRARLFPCTSAPRTRCGHKAAGVVVGVNVQFTKHIHITWRHLLLRCLINYLDTCIFACLSDLLNLLFLLILFSFQLMSHPYAICDGHIKEMLKKKLKIEMLFIPTFFLAQFAT